MRATVARCPGSCLRLGEDASGLVPVAGILQGTAEAGEGREAARIVGWKQAVGPPEQARRRPQVSAGDRPQSRGREPCGGTPGQGEPAVACRPQLDAVSVGALQVVADDLVELHEIGAVLAHPGREELVHLRTNRFRQRVVGCVADQQVAEPVGVLARKLRALRPNELAAHERRERSPELDRGRGQCLHRAAVEHPTLDGAALEHSSFRRIELIEARRKERLDRRRHRDGGAGRIPHEADHLLDEEGIPLGRVDDAAA